MEFFLAALGSLSLVTGLGLGVWTLLQGVESGVRRWRPRRRGRGTGHR